MKVTWRRGLLLAGLLVGCIGSVLAQADDSKGMVVDLGGVKSRTPADWKPMQTTSAMRAYQFQVPQEKGEKQDAELIVYWFNGGGGSAAANVKRWKAQFQPPEGKSIDEVTKVHKTDLAGGKVKATYVDIHGTFRAPVFRPGQKSDVRPHTRMLAVVFETQKGPYFIRLVGPEKTVAAHKSEFDHWLKAFHS